MYSYSKMELSVLSTNKLQSLIYDQNCKLPKSVNFDYRNLIDENDEMNESTLEQYFNKDLVDVIDTITTSRWTDSGHTQTESYKHTRKLRVLTIAAMLSYAMNPKACFFQTLIGLVCYSFGLRDRGYDMLNALGICCSSDQVRKHGSIWANKRRATDELDGRQFWRVSFDNLNFKMNLLKH